MKGRGLGVLRLESQGFGLCICFGRFQGRKWINDYTQRLGATVGIHCFFLYETPSSQTSRILNGDPLQKDKSQRIFAGMLWSSPRLGLPVQSYSQVG